MALNSLDSPIRYDPDVRCQPSSPPSKSDVSQVSLHGLRAEFGTRLARRRYNRHNVRPTDKGTEMSKAVHHVVTRPGHRQGDPETEIPVAEDLVTVPGSPTIDGDVSYYSREYPVESQTVEKSADRDWGWTQYITEVYDYRKKHDKVTEPLIEAAAVSGDIEPTAEPEPGRDVTADIRSKARELGFGEVGFTRYDRRYTYASKKSWVKYRHAICLALEQDYYQTQTIPSLEAEFATLRDLRGRR